MKKLLAVLLFSFSSFAFAQIGERWVVIADSSEGVSIFVDVNTFSFKTGKTLDESLAFARLKFIDKRSGKVSTEYAMGYVNLTACVNGGGKLALARENGPAGELDIHLWTAKGPTLGDGIGDALCAIYDISQKRRM